MSNKITELLHWGIELTWVSPHHLGLTKELKQKLQVFINKCLGKIRRLWWPKRIRNEELWRQEGQRPMEEEIKKKNEHGDGLAKHCGDQTNMWSRQLFNGSHKGSFREGDPDTLGRAQET